MSQQQGAFESIAVTQLNALGADPSADALDAWADPAGAAAALGSLADQASLVMRAAVELPASQSSDGSGPEPAAPWWIRVTKGSAEIKACPEMGAAKDGCETRRASRVLVECGPLPDGAPGSIARALVALDKKGDGSPAKLLVAEAWARTEELACARVRPVASRLARALSVPASLPETATASEGDAADEGAPQVHVAARSLARFSLRSEGARLVLRDFASRGPREGAGFSMVVGLALAGVAAGLWFGFANSARAVGATAAVSLAWLGGAALFTLGAVAFLGVARFSMAYGATSEPLVAIGVGRIMVAPWVSRRGAVMLHPEGRFGAGIVLGEVRGVSVQDRKGQHAVEVATDHGPIDALLTEDANIAQLLCGALSRALDDLRPESGPNARQRFRARATAK
ncbi:MAG: hypothetical protein U0441_38015 [Polyangiaceae bacterium]